ncbi:Stb3p KNAG_0A04950 [Huiozyma naganishii CBS 8797]|uniref:Uncharacterized protein n=1 Tax=Huiozyma naganishii (strain ATCC MYA-139 / BCRC 22969 / CBS 8797 / KCTC 17520 / NBRC 10181 / NCYC 3082 / Yp74L-3) TaxID=1071383 RepID=J7RF27_HUIN7|nr:hypothetical protein KNAG_0A04950 [Kazachstania naganishii CBS 8797]CCK68163.1 hypothetical protein KNAG_0A04950 [Kazachstania naganishii CBS 8797]
MEQRKIPASCPLAMEAASKVTPQKLAELLTLKGPMAIRYINKELCGEILGFQSLSTSKQRRLIIHALETGLCAEGLVFEKIGWGQWTVRKVCVTSEEGFDPPQEQVTTDTVVECADNEGRRKRCSITVALHEPIWRRRKILMNKSCNTAATQKPNKIQKDDISTQKHSTQFGVIGSKIAKDVENSIREVSSRRSSFGAQSSELRSTLLNGTQQSDCSSCSKETRGSTGRRVSYQGEDILLQSPTGSSDVFSSQGRSPAITPDESSSPRYNPCVALTSEHVSKLTLDSDDNNSVAYLLANLKSLAH